MEYFHAGAPAGGVGRLAAIGGERLGASTWRRRERRD